MGNVLGIIAEYNPFHNGHLYHLNESKKITNCDTSIALISGNFTQRGSTSIIDKWEKTKLALNNGIDLVIELPTLYSISSAENFADGAIKILNSLNIIDYLSFGTETDDITKLNKISDILIEEPEEYKKYLSIELKKGLSYPKAREIAISKYLNDASYSDILSSPNNILGLEYVKAIKKHKSTIKTVCINRFNCDYNSNNSNNGFASSTAIRNFLNKKQFDSIKNVVPECTYLSLLKNFDNKNIVIDLSCFEKEIIYILRKLTIEEISNLPDVSEGLEYLIKKSALSFNDLDCILNNIKSKRYTQTRINRIFLYALLGITKNDIKISKQIQPYIRVLGFNNKGKDLISKISKNNPNLPIIISTKKFIDNNRNKDLELLLNKDILSSNIYTLALNNSIANIDFTNNIIKL